MFRKFYILKQHGKQYIANISDTKLLAPFRGRPEISAERISSSAQKKLRDICPLVAIQINPLRIDLGKCAFCGECARICPKKIRFTTDLHLSSNIRENLIISEKSGKNILFDSKKIRKELKIFKNSLKLREISAGGDNSAEMELGACGNANFDMGRFGIEFVASPRHADGIVITGPITKNMVIALKETYKAIPKPKIIILCGTDAISGGLFIGSEALDRSFLKKVSIDLFIPGNPPHPLTIINGLLNLLQR